jgi:Flp pilus assembly pilin Flp
MATEKQSGTTVRYALLAVLLGVVLLPTFPYWVAAMATIWPVVLVGALGIGVAHALAR